MSADTQTLINFYGRQRFYRHIQAVCNDALKKRGDDPVLIFWKAFGLLNEGSTSEAIRELESINGKRDVQLAVTSALIVAHNKYTHVDSDALESLNAKLRDDLKASNEKGFLLAAYFHWHNGDTDKAREYSKFPNSQPQFLGAQILAGWIDLTSGRESLIRKSIGQFEKAINGPKKEIEALLGKAKFLELQHDYSQSLEILNNVIVLFSWFLPALTEKAKILLMMGDWDQAYETVHRVVASQDSYNIEALRLLILCHLVRESRYSVVSKRMGELIQALDMHEPKNATLYYTAAKTFSRLAGRNAVVLQQCLTLIEKAKSIDPNNAVYGTEYGFQQLLLGNVKSASTAFKNAMKLDETSEVALNGMIKCQILEGDLESAEKQLDFLNEIQNTKNADICFLSAVLVWRKYHDQERAIRLLNDTYEIHLKSLIDTPLSLEYFAKFNPDFILEISKELLQHCGTDPLDPADPPSSVLNKVIKLLEILGKAVPGLLECFFLLARAKFIANDDDGAQRTLEQCLKLSPSYAEAHMLMAQLYLKQEKPKQALSSLEQSLSHNFEVRDSPLYHLIKARVHEQLGENEESLKLLEAALKLPGVKPDAGPMKKKITNNSAASPQVSLYDRVSIYLQLASTYLKLNQTSEATKIMQEGMNDFKGTSEEVRFIIANANFALKQGDPYSALTMLSNISSEKPYYVKAQMTMAEIYLIHRSDKRMFISCFRKLVESNSSMHTLLLLGDAYMKIQEPEKAIQVYQTALDQNPSDSGLARKIGKALTTTHDYQKAINYYDNAVKSNPSNSVLRHDLAELLTKLKRFDQAERVLRETLEEQKENYDYAMMINDVKIYMLIAKVHMGAGTHNKAAEALQKAHDLQNKIKGEQADFIRAQRQMAAQICYNLAEYYHSHNNLEKAQSFYNEALRHDETHEQSILALAKLYLSRGELDPCQHQCITLLRMDSGNEEASMMLADLMFRKNEYELATFHFQQLLERKPTHFSALARLIQLLRRAGKLNEVPRFLKMAENLSKRATMEPGLHYCKGLYFRYTNNPREALTEFYAARKDTEWGEKTLFHMIEIYLNPDNETLFEGATEDKEYMKAVNSAKELLKELPSTPKTLKHAVLECCAQMSSKNKQDVEEAWETLRLIVNQDRNFVPALLGIAQAHIIRKEIPKARNQLKRIAKMTYNTEEAEEFERSWLLLAQIYIEMGKFDLAQELLKRCLNYNNSCAKAWELLGFIMEKEQSYRDAADHYEHAWKMENESNPTIGFRLAFNYLKAKRYVEAIDVCHKILALYPEYPKIRKEILDRARISIRC